jgi:DNA repair protein RadD
MTDLRKYQRDVVDQVAEAIEQGKRRIIVVAPTGAGKTVIAAALIKAALERGQQ